MLSGGKERYALEDVLVSTASLVPKEKAKIVTENDTQTMSSVDKTYRETFYNVFSRDDQTRKWSDTFVHVSTTREHR